nr:unnamed protein product [Spirometra erinaceieuropaei]
MLTAVTNATGKSAGAKLRCLYTNAQSLISKLDELKLCLAELSPDVLAVTETWLSGNINDNEVALPGYQIYRRDREHRQGGGIVVYVNDGLAVSDNTTKFACNTEAIWLTIKATGSPCLDVLTVYRPPRTDQISDTELLVQLENFSSRPNIMIIGDFNAPGTNGNTLQASGPKSAFDYRLLGKTLNACLTQHTEAASDCQRVSSRKSRDASGSNPAFRGSTASSYTDINGDYSPHKSTEKSSPDTNSRRATLKRSSADPSFTTKVASGKRTKSGSASAVKNTDGNGSIATAAAAAVGNSAVIASDSGHSSSSPALASASSNQQASMLQTSAQIFSSAASSASSVSPATLSSSSGIGSSLSDQKSVDASPGDLGVSLHSTLSSLPIDPAIVKAIEERVRQKLNERIEALILERDRAREKLSQMESYVAKLEHDHKVELCECKKRSWCVICLKEALYHCCAGVAYCSKECQLKHWTSQHSRECRRLAEAQRSTTAPAN